MILVIAVLLSARACRRVRLADAGRLRQEDLQKRGQLGPQLGPQVRNRRPLLEQIPLSCVVRSSSPAPLRRGDSRPDEARSASTRARTSAKRFDREPWRGDKLVGGGRGLGHPDRQKRQGPVGLADDEVIGAGMTLGADNGDDLAAARVERIRDPNLKRRTPGSMTLVRRAWARRIFAWVWASGLSSRASRFSTSALMS